MRRIAACVALLAVARCAPADLLNATIPTGGLAITRDVAYGPDPRMRMDIYRPRTAAHLPVVVFFYGGSWRTGSKRIYPFVAATLARKGIVVAVPDYRLYPTVRYPVFLEDCARAASFVHAHAAAYGGDATRFYLMGHSAGAYNAVMLALDTPYLAEAGLGRQAIAGVIGLAGPYDFAPITDADIVPVFAASRDEAETQPVRHVDGHVPPMLLIAGTADREVRPRNTEALGARLRAAGDRVEVRLYPGVGHIGLVTAFAPLFQARAPVLGDVVRFVSDARP